MEQYFIAENNKQTGPFTKDELKSKRISKQTLIWKEGLDHWQEAETIEELKDCIIAMPPSLPQNAKKQYLSTEQKTALKKSFKFSFWIFILLGMCMAYFVGGFSSRYDLAETLRNFNVYATGDDPESKRWVLLLAAAYISLLPATTCFIIAYFSKIMNIKIQGENIGVIFIIIVAVIATLVVIIFSNQHVEARASNMSISQYVYFFFALITIILFAVLSILLYRQKNTLNKANYIKAFKSSSLTLLLILALAIIIAYVTHDDESNKYTWINFISSCWHGLTFGIMVSFAIFLWKQPLNSLSEIINKDNE